MIKGISLRIAIFVACLFAAGSAFAQIAQVDVPPTAEDPFQIMGFADLNYVSADSQSADGFTIGQAVAHIIAPVAERLNLFGEISATARDSEYNFELERIIVKYDFNNYYSLSAGRYHSPIGYWNEAYHHGAWLQTSVARPQIVRFGTPLVPIHFVGLLFDGDVTAPNSGLSYSVGLGNGRHSNIARAGDAGDINGNRAWLASLKYAPTSSNGLKAGIGTYSDRVTQPGGLETDEKIHSAYLALERESPEVIVEVLHAEHDATSGLVSGDIDSYYAHVAYRLPGERSAFKPYFRVEDIDVSDNGPLPIGSGMDYEGRILGVRYDFAPYASLKFEYRNEEFGNLGRENNFQVQLSLVLVRN